MVSKDHFFVQHTSGGEMSISVQSKELKWVLAGEDKKNRVFDSLITAVTFEKQTLHFSGQADESRLPSRPSRKTRQFPRNNNLIHLGPPSKIIRFRRSLAVWRNKCLPYTFAQPPLRLPCDSKFAYRKSGCGTVGRGMPSYVAGKVDGSTLTRGARNRVNRFPGNVHVRDTCARIGAPIGVTGRAR